MTQQEALSILKTGANVFLTGEPGSGKSHTINAYVAYLRAHGIEPAITASTGIAATHIGGMTIHSFSGIGTRRTLTPYDLDAITGKEWLVKRIRKTKMLIIDEVSMLDADTLESVELVMRTVKRSEEPFGGMQVVFVGDFFQLPPVVTKGAMSHADDLFAGEYDGPRFAFMSRAWEQARPLTCYLTEQHRQDDPEFSEVLAALRSGSVDELHYERLMSRHVQPDEHAAATQLYTHNLDVDRMNHAALDDIQGTARMHYMHARGADALVAALKKGCLSPDTLYLKVGARVMFTRNNFDAGYVNGTLGEVVEFDAAGLPIVRTQSGGTITAEPAEWIIEQDGRELAKIIQVPLRLAWAITVHKSQGMTLDAAVMDLSGTFEYGQGYVAISRVRTLAGLYLRGLNARALEVHPVILEHDSRFREDSANAAAAFAAMTQEELSKLHANFITAMGGTLRSAKKAPKQKAADKPKSDYLVRIREKYPNAYRPWSEADDAKLVEMFAADVSFEALSESFARQPTAIRARLVKLGLIEEEGGAVKN